MRLIVKWILSLGLLAANGGCETSPLEQALRASGKNRGELEKVLEHYSQPADSLKLRAAKFLIENMPGHYTLDESSVNALRDSVNRDPVNGLFAKKLFDVTLKHFTNIQGEPKKREDVECITADYLIRHIDASFKTLNQYSWLDVIPFDYFLEYVLPYRFEQERLDLWRDSLLAISSEDNIQSIIRDFGYSFLSMRSRFKLECDKNENSKQVDRLLKLAYNDDCYTRAYKNFLEYRIMGIPVTMDFIPFYSRRNGYHYWVEQPPLMSKIAELRDAADKRPTKVYRRTFSRNEFLVPRDGEYVPEFFQDPFNKDVTDLYFTTSEMKITAGEGVAETPAHAYLCVFNHLDWRPVAGTRMDGREAIFKNMVGGIVYLPVFYKNQDEACPLNYPFIQNSIGRVEYLIPDTTRCQPLRLERKYFHSKTHEGYYEMLDGVVVEASADRSFKQVDTVFTLRASGQLIYRLESDAPGAYKYFRLRAKYLVYLAELFFFAADGKRLDGKVDTRFEAIFDNDPLTSLETGPKTPVVVSFEKPVNVAKFVCLPRGDGNGIYPGDKYELRYYGHDGWHSLGEKVATDYYIEYDRVPTGALLWLRNLTSGVEERVFTVENGEIKFW